MAPMEPTKAENGHFSSEALEKELSERKTEELQEMAKRLSRGTEGLQQMMVDLEAEKQQLKEENASLHSTIDLMMKELQKLNIGSDNTVEPLLDEGPLDFVGRFWEKVKPRDNTYLINDNVGEIRRPEPGEEEGNELGRIAQKRAKEVGQQVQGALGPLWSRAEGLLSAAQEELQSQVAAQREKRAAAPEGRERAGSGFGGLAGFGGGLGSLLSKGQELLESRRGGGYAQAAGSSDSPASREQAAASQAPAAPAAPAPAAAKQEVAPSPAPTAEPAAKAAEPAVKEKPEPKVEVEEAPAGPEEQISSTVLIEASLKLEDGTVETLQVRAADRCKEVSHRFVQEHSLKAWFEAPLTAWLKKVEADAVKFPVKVEGDLVEIRKNNSKSK